MIEYLKQLDFSGNPLLYAVAAAGIIFVIHWFWFAMKYVSFNPKKYPNALVVIPLIITAYTPLVIGFAAGNLKFGAGVVALPCIPLVLFFIAKMIVSYRRYIEQEQNK